MKNNFLSRCKEVLFSTNRRALKLSKKITYALLYATLLEIIGRTWYLLKHGFTLGHEPTISSIIAGSFVACFFFWWSKFYEAKTAKRILFYISFIAISRTIGYAALISPKLFLLGFPFYILSIGCEGLLIIGCFAHLRYLKK